MNSTKLKTVLLAVWFMASLAAAQVEPSGQARYEKKLHSLLKHTVPLITAPRLKGETGAGGPLVILDTRELEEYRVSHIRGARHVGYENFDITSLEDIPKDRPIVLYCSLGVRSERIGEKLQKAGYTNVRNLFGGIFQWVNQDYPVYVHVGTRTNKIHAFSKKWSRWLLRGEKVFEERK